MVNILYFNVMEIFGAHKTKAKAFSVNPLHPVKIRWGVKHKLRQTLAMTKPCRGVATRCRKKKRTQFSQMPSMASLGPENLRS
jgi:hypothetical protein